MRRLPLGSVVIFVVTSIWACSGSDGKPTTLPPPDAGTDSGGDVAPTTPQPIGADCTDDGQCLSGHCFVGGKASWCTVPCTAANAATVCVPAPPLDGTCNNQGFCRRPN
jgi:hypothetical protein